MDAEIKSDSIMVGNIMHTVPPMLVLKSTDANEVLRFEPNGDIFIHGKLVVNDIEIVEGFKDLLGIAPTSVVKHPIGMDGKENKKRNYCYQCGTTVKSQKFCHECGRKLIWPGVKELLVDYE